MKKHLLTLATAVAIAATSAFAITPQRSLLSRQGTPLSMQRANIKAANTAVARAPQAAEAEGYEINFCGNPYDALTFGLDDATYRCYIHISPEIATQLAGNKLTTISLSPVLLASNSLDGYIFVSEDLNADPATKTDVTFTTSYNPTTQVQSFQTHALADPYVIKEGTGFYFGYVINHVKGGENNDFVIGLDDQMPNPFCGTAEAYVDGELAVYADVSEAGGNLLLKAMTVGEKTGITDLINVENVSLGDFSLYVADHLSGNKAKMAVTNLGSNEITSMGYTIAVEGGQTVTETKAVSIPSMAAGTFDDIAIPDLANGRGKVTFTLDKVNGKDIDPVSFGIDYIGLDGGGYPRKFVVEEATGTWCGFCPRGIVGFDYMSSTHPDSFIGIAVHSGDAMETASYEPFLMMISGYPECVINRDPMYATDPDAEELAYCYDAWQSQKAIASVALETATPADGKISVTATTTFAIDDAQADYSLAFVTLEDGIMGIQQNYYAGGYYGEMGGWESKGESVRTEYKHVARNIFEYFGLEGSIPAQVTKGEPVTFSYDVPLDNVSNVSKSSVVALLIDNTSGTILNAAQVHADAYGTSGIGDIITETTDAPVEYYNLQGIRMADDQLPAGVYITRQGDKTAKVLVK